MNALRSVLLLVTPVLILVTLGGAIPTAQASTRIPASGAFAPIAPPTAQTSRSADGNVLGTDTVTLALTGTFTGTIIFNERFVNHPSGVSNDRAVGTFTGSVNGASGTAVIAS